MINITKKLGIMKTTVNYSKSEIMKLAWQFIKKNGMNMSNALTVAWRNIKIRAKMQKQIVKFYFQKVDGSVREAFGTLKAELLPAHEESSRKKKNDTVQTYFDTEKSEWRCFKKANLISIAY